MGDRSVFVLMRPLLVGSWMASGWGWSQEQAMIRSQLLVAQMVKNLPVMQETWVQSWVGKTPWSMEVQPTLVFLPGEFHEQRAWWGYNPSGHKKVGHDWVSNTFTFQVGRRTRQSRFTDNRQSCPYMMTPPWKSVMGLESFWVGEHTHRPREWYTPTPLGQKLLCLATFQTLPYVPLHLAVYLYLFLYPLQ